MVEEYNERYDNICHIKVEGVDPIGTSMNRCIEHSTGDYLCIWNVDDLRTSNSIEIMADVLDKNSDIDIVYGNFNIVNKFGATQGQYVDVKPYISELKIGMILGPFFMFRKSLIDKAGILVRNGKAHFMSNILGYYLNEGLGQSTKPDSKQPIEQTVIEMRYGVRIIHQHLVQLARNSYDIDNIIVSDKKTPAINFYK